MTPRDILIEINDKHGEWIEMAGEESSALIIDILCYKLIHEREHIKHLEKRIDYERAKTKHK
jgi:hypothetical protein